MARKDIKDRSTALKVPFLLHFTRATNLPSIIQHGLYPVARTCEIGVAPEINDPHRFDGHLGATSLSIAFPNYRMFYKLRTENAGVEWVVLAIHPSVLWTKDCAFCRHNAADGRISGQPLASLKTLEAFAGMFEETEGENPRAEQKLKSFDPTDGQAEILVFDAIEPELIRGVVFGGAAIRDAHKAILGDRQILVNAANKGYFAARSYVRVPR